MKVDARPFFLLATATASCRCLRPTFNPRSVGVGGSERAGGVISVECTHIVTAFNPLPADLTENSLVTINDSAPPARYRVLRNGIARTPAGADLYLAADVVEGTAPYVARPEGTPEPTRPAGSQRLPYVADQ